MTLDLKRTDHFALLVRVLMTFPLESTKRLNLGQNRIRSLQQLQPIVDNMPQINWLNVSGSAIQRWDELTYVSKWPIEGISCCLQPMTNIK